MSKKRYQLTWRPREHRWQKKFKRKIYYLPVDAASTKEGSYATALKRWEIMKGRLLAGLPPTDEPVENGYPVSDAISKREQLRDIAIAANDSAAANSFQEQIDELSSLPTNSQVDRWTYDPLRHISEQGRAVWRERAKLFGKDGSNNGKRIRATIKEYQEQRKVEIGLKLSEGTVRTSNIHLDRFLQWLKTDIPLTAFNEQLLNDYVNSVLREISEHKLTPRYGNHLLASLKQFLRWSIELGYMDSLRNLASKRHSFRVSVSEIVTISRDEIRTLLLSSNDLMRLYILLALNCGFTQVDIVSLADSEVDWENGVVKRRRTKTKHITTGTIPVVSYKLWHETFELLCKFRSGLTKVLQEPQVHHDQKIARDFTMLQAEQIPNKTYTFKHLRKTGASLLTESKYYAQLHEYYLGHSPKTIATKHYAKPGDNLFFEALEWMRSELGLQTYLSFT